MELILRGVIKRIRIKSYLDKLSKKDEIKFVEVTILQYGKNYCTINLDKKHFSELSKGVGKVISIPMLFVISFDTHKRKKIGKLEINRELDFIINVIPTLEKK